MECPQILLNQELIHRKIEHIINNVINNLFNDYHIYHTSYTSRVLILNYLDFQ